MTHSEARALIEKKICDAKALIENAKGGDALDVKTTLGYYDDDLNESAEYDERGETSLIGDVEIRLPSRDSEEDPFVSIGILCDLERGDVKAEEGFAGELENFDKEIEEFVKALSNTENVEQFLTEASDKLDAESEKMVKELEQKLARLNKFMKIGTVALVVLAIVIIVAKTLL